MANEQVKRMLQENDAVLVSYGYSVQFRCFTLVRRFPKVLDAFVEDALEYANANISATNSGLTITSPKAKGSDKDGFEGTWRLLKNERPRNAIAESAQGMTQTLVLGISWSWLAKLTSKSGALAAYTDYFFNLTEAEAGTFSPGYGSPEGWDAVNGRPVAGWEFQVGDPQLNPENGYYSIQRVRRNNAGDLTASGDWGGGTASDEHFEDDVLIRDLARHTGAAVPLPDVPFTAEGTTVETKNRRRDDLLFDTEREQRDSKKQEIAEHLAGEAHDERRRRKVGRNLRVADVGAYAVLPADGEAVDLALTKNPDGTQDAQLERKLAINIATATTAAGHLESRAVAEQTASASIPASAPADGQAAEVDASVATYRGRWRTRRTVRTAIDVQTAANQATALESAATLEHSATPTIPAPAPGDGEAAAVDANPTDYLNRWRTRRIVRTAIDVETASTQATAGETVAIQEHTATAAVPDPARVTGQIVETSSDPTDYVNRKRTRRTVRTAINQVASFERAGAMETGATSAETQGAAIPPPAPGDGQAAEVDASPTPYGLYSFRRHVRTAIDVPTVATQATAGETVATEEHSATAAVPDPARVTGQIVETSSDPTDYVNRKRTRRTVRTATDQVGAYAEETLFEKRETTTHSQAAVAPVASFVDGSGVIIETQDQPTPYGLKATVERKRTAKFSDTGWIILAGGHSITAQREIRNAPSTVVDWPSGIPRRVGGQVKKNEFGKWDMDLYADYDVESGHTPGAQYKAYSVSTPIEIQESMSLGSTRYKRTKTATLKACGSKNPATVMAYLASCNHQVSFDPQSDGRFFHGKGILVDDGTFDWSEDMSGVVP